MIPLMRPYMTDAIKKRVCDVLDSGHLTEGPVTREFERCVAEYVGCAHALAVTSCTTGLEVALRALGVGPGDEVIVPDFTYPASASVVAILGATPVIVDVDQNSMLITRKAAEQAITPRTKAIMPVSIFGNPLDYSWINALKREYGLAVVEDAACSLGSEWNGKRVGSFADISVFSLHPRKFITTGEGGVITTDNAELAAKMHRYKHFGISNSEADRGQVRFTEIGTNYKLSDVLAAIGLGQMQDIDLLLSERRTLAARYFELLAGVDGISFPAVTENGLSSWQTFCVYVDNRDLIKQRMFDRQIQTQIGTYSLHAQPAFQDARSVLKGGFAGSGHVYAKSLALPMYHGMTGHEQSLVASSLADVIRGLA